MYIRTDTVSNDSFPVLDDEFDKFASAGGQIPSAGQYIYDDLSWEDQLNDGHELSM